jgi:hypothetical protein
MSGLPMTPREVKALNEVHRHDYARVLYWFRPKTMQLLHARGLVEQWTPPSVRERPRLKARPWRLTEEGRAYLARMNTLDLLRSKDRPQ